MFYLIRHATNDLVGKAIPGWMPGVHLNADGRAQAERVAEKLAGRGITKVYSSPLERAVETAGPIAKIVGAPAEIREGLGEIRAGEWTGKTLTELDADRRWRRFNEYRGGAPVPGGELMIECQARMVAELLCLREEHPQETLAVISHADPLRAVLAYFLGMPLDLYIRIEISPASVSVLRLEEWGAQVLRLNDTSD